ncbi:FixH family protein [Heyndrickxia sp. NPDC080065]|uniref:FixH family protein n=1 Tax=Heyndrickxia sp. NPDC080065 TaxID=3390568 RepID=UPI003D07988F
MKKILLFLLIILGVFLSACSNDKNESKEFKMLEVKFLVPKTAKIKELVELKAIVTYGDEKVKDANEVSFEYWEKGNRNKSTMVEAKNNKDGTYTANVSFDHAGAYEMYAHTTARDLHMMPKKSIEIRKAEAP